MARAWWRRHQTIWIAPMQCTPLGEGLIQTKVSLDALASPTLGQPLPKPLDQRHLLHLHSANLPRRTTGRLPGGYRRACPRWGTRTYREDRRTRGSIFEPSTQTDWKGHHGHRALVFAG